MTRTDRRGRPLKAFLQAEIASADVTVEEMRKACGLTRASYYGEPSGTGRGFDDTFPNSEELRQVAEYYGLGDDGWVSLLVEFGWLEPLPGTRRVPFTAGAADREPATPIGLVRLRDALSRYENASVLLISPGVHHDGVHLVPLRTAIEEQLDGSLVVFGVDPPVDEE
jgi:hypothetical protein